MSDTASPLSISTHTIDDIEACIEELARFEWKRDLVLPGDLSKWQCGGAAALLQLILSWARNNPSGRLYTDVPIENHDRLQKVFQGRPHGIVAGLMKDRVYSRTGVDRAADVRGYATTFLRNSERSMQRMGPRVLMLCADHTPYSRLPPLYSNEGKIRRSSYRFVAGKILRTVFGSNKYHIDARTQDALIDVLFELFQNTHEWGRHDSYGRVLPCSVRGILLQAYEPHDLSNTSLSQQVGRSIVGFVDHHNAGGTPCAFLEINIFDSGDGYAAPYKGGEIDEATPVEDEYAIVEKCLSLHTSKSGRSDKGVGLHSVLSALSGVGGYLRLRTGRLALCRDFVADPYDLVRPYLSDWATQGQTPTPMPSLRGAFLTLLIPIKPIQSEQHQFWG